MMPQSNVCLVSLLAVALASAVACGGGNDQMQPQTPANTPTTTGAPVEPPTTPLYGESPPSNGSAPSPSPPDTTAATPPTGGTPGGTLTTNGVPPTPATPQSAPSSQGTASQGATRPSQTSLTMSDGQIASVIDAAAAAAVDEAREAAKKAKNERVRRFAQQVLADYSTARSKLASIESKASISPQENPTTEQMRARGDRTLSTLRSASGKDVDQTFIEARLSQENELIQLLDDKLIAQAQTAELRTHLQNLRATAATHVTTGQSIQTTLTK